VAPGRFIAIHGHFYQPPRENPWLEAVEVQDSAAPYHDWNERVTAECYAPNTAARRVDDHNRILDVVDNYARISFNVGPTLAAWLDRHAPTVYRKIIEADRASVAAHGGHGNAIAQVYNHMIMPLATRRDKVTQVRWGIDDFRARFGRDPEGLWLPETAVDTETLEVVAEAGIKFTILAPSQAWRVRPLDGGDWQEVNGAVDPSRPYLWRGPHGLTLALFLYDGPISRAVAFEGLLESGEKLARRLLDGFSAARDEDQLVHCATDGESYGHHSRFGEMALASALERLEADGSVRLTNYGEFLATHPPRWEAQIHENTSWSCAHGVERWRADCGCRVRGDWSQAWRGPLRQALDRLRDEVDTFYEARAGALLKDPWEARDDYAAVVRARSPERLEAFFARHQTSPLDIPGQLQALRLLEMQRNRLLMYTSCGWFFDEISGIEPVQILRYAAMAMQYLRDLGGGHAEPEFIRQLAAAPSNVPEFADGAEVYRRLIRPAVVDLRRVVAHYAITDLVEEHPDDLAVYAYHVQRLDQAREAYGGTALRIAHVRVSSRLTGEAREAMYAVLHFGGHDFACGIRGFDGHAVYDAMKTDLLRRYSRYTLADMVRGMDEHFPGEGFSLTDLFLEERRRVLAFIIRGVLDRHEETYRRIWEDNRKLMRYLHAADAPIPDALALVGRHVLEQDITDAMASIGDSERLPEHVTEMLGEAKALGLALDLTPAKAATTRAVSRALQAVAEEPSAERVARATALVTDALRLGLRFGLWESQNRFFAIWRARPDARPALAPLATALGFNLTGARR
jgi:alpha-amylase/alpha-mannosidase (GH57 family)